MAWLPRRTVSDSLFRGRQRTREPIRQFNPEAAPEFCEVGVDLLNIRVSGSWRQNSHQDQANPEYRMNPYEFGESIPVFSGDVTWLKAAQRKPDRTLIVETKNRNSSLTISHTKAIYKNLGAIDPAVGRQPRGGQIDIWLSLNPTRTLSHLIHALGEAQGSVFPEDQTFFDLISELPALSFFSAHSGVPRSLDGKDNWLSDLTTVRRCLGPDPFSVFLPIFCEKVTQYAALFLAPNYDALTSSNGSSTEITVPGISATIEWGLVRIQQIETYYERYLPYAVAATREAAIRAIDQLSPSTVGVYDLLQSFYVERDANSVSVRSELRDGLTVIAYPKHASRMRFEIRRTKAAKYEELADTCPTDRLLGILNWERGELESRARWPELCRFLDARPQPTLKELSTQIALLADVASRHQVSAGDILEHLLDHAGSSYQTGGLFSDALVLDLAKVGILERRSSRLRRRSSDKYRYGLNDWWQEFAVLVVRGLGR
ncbi:hypothetical protein [Parasphingorhabdus sp.]|uniref:hypothetical protein n=1 Tax=Parasphingorhabdus sp. TaxID=2709688 RepID=UPI003A918E73